MAGNFQMSDYVDVAERIRQFYDKYPEGSLQSYRDPQVMEVGGKPFIAYSAAAYRTKDDPIPGIGWAWEPIPGPSNFTRDSELMNAETAAWGRAILACGFASKHVASQEEVRNRQPERPAQRPQEAPRPQAPANTGAPEAPPWWDELRALRDEHTVSVDEIEAFLMKKPSGANIQAWLDDDPGREVRHLISAIVDLRAARTERQGAMA